MRAKQDDVTDNVFRLKPWELKNYNICLRFLKNTCFVDGVAKLKQNFPRRVTL